MHDQLFFYFGNVGSVVGRRLSGLEGGGGGGEVKKTWIIPGEKTSRRGEFRTLN